MNTLGSPIKNVRGIHYGQKLHQVVTVPAILKKDSASRFIQPDSLNLAAIRTLEVMTIGPNESKTGLVLAGNYIEKNGNPLFPDDLKKNFKDKIEIPFDQANVSTQAGTWMCSEDNAQAYAKSINVTTKAATKHIVEAMRKIDIEIENSFKTGV